MEKHISNQIKVTGIILSAGLSSRMKDFKPLLKLKNGKSFIRSIVENISSVCNEVVIVTGHNEKAIIDDLNILRGEIDFRIVHNDQFGTGMFSSLKTAIQKSNADWYLYHFVDQPSLTSTFYRTILSFTNKKSNWIQPVHNGRKGHPILFDNYIKKLILEDDFKSLRELSRKPEITKYFFDYNSYLIFEDIDTPNDFAKLD